MAGGSRPDQDTWQRLLGTLLIELEVALAELRRDMGLGVIKYGSSLSFLMASCSRAPGSCRPSGYSL